MAKKSTKPGRDGKPALSKRQLGFIEDLDRIPRTSFTGEDALEFMKKVRTGELASVVP